MKEFYCWLYYFLLFFDFSSSSVFSLPKSDISSSSSSDKSSSSLSESFPLRLLREDLLAAARPRPPGDAAGRPRLPAPVDGHVRLGAASLSASDNSDSSSESEFLLRDPRAAAAPALRPLSPSESELPEGL